MTKNSRLYWRRIPFTFMLTVIWAALKGFGANLQTSTGFGIAMILMTFVVIVLEFFKSADIGTKSFFTDTFFSVLTTATVSAVATFFIMKNGWGVMGVTDVIFAAMILVDGVVNPWMSFSMALRNLQGNVGTTEVEEAT